MFVERNRYKISMTKFMPIDRIKFLATRGIKLWKLLLVDSLTPRQICLYTQF